MATSMDVGIFGINPLTGQTLQLGVDPTFMAARIAMRPLEYTGNGAVLGHYAVSQVSGNITATLGALAHSASIRWSDATRYLVLMRVRVGWSVVTAVTAAVPTDMRAIIVRGFSVDFTTNSTAISMSAVTSTQKMRNTMGTSLMGTNGPRILTTAAMSGQTVTADAAPFAMTCWPSQLSTNGTGTAVALPVGASGPMVDLYNWQNLGQHPVVLSVNEGVILQPVTAVFATGTFKYYTQWEWAEVAVF